MVTQVGGYQPLLQELYRRLSPDAWRLRNGFSSDLQSTADVLHSSFHNRESKEQAFRDWLRRWQPCLFGRIAARDNLISFCFIDHEDVQKGDHHVKDLIQNARSAWKREAYEGRKSAFIIALLSDRLLVAEPNEDLLALAQRIATLYLLTDEIVEPNKIYMDDLMLEVPDYRRTTFRWTVGANVFLAAGDKRWWSDHRVPCGLALSMNSVGHLVKSTLIARGMTELERKLDAPVADLTTDIIDSLPVALDVAMRTINLATKTPFGRATELVPAEASRAGGCPVKISKPLESYDCHQYLGKYHTDQTLPSEYFRPELEPPDILEEHRLDFTYLFDSSVNNPAHLRMGRGELVRDDDDFEMVLETQKLRKVHGEEVS